MQNGRRCVIIGGAGIADYDFIRGLMREDDYVIYCDSGLKHMEALGARPSLIVGDFDSSSLPQESDAGLIALPREKDDTDTMYCVKLCLRRGYRRFLLLGMTGGREDHTYANLCTLLYLHNRGAEAEIIDGNTEISVISGEKSKAAHVLDIDENCRLIVRYKDGSKEALSSGEVSVRMS